MRFHADGPIIPDELLQQQREGNTIFFCGAGVSMPAGLPSFAGLASGIIKTLGSKKAVEPFQRHEYDRAFNALFREFGREEIDKQLYNALRTPRKPNLSNHQNLLALSRSADNLPQLVTTNFDQLFERAEKGIQVCVPPALPSLDLNQSVEGVVYLHGRLISPQSAKRPAYIVSSSDFGRAYLSEGWAAKFVKSLREQFAIVLVGYRAEDPPMRYLLEGLHSTVEHRYSHPIYAFTPGEADEAEELWSERGVTPIPYDNSDGAHGCLWKTIDAWAQAVREPEVWTAKMLSLAQQAPHEMQPFERGQVCQLINTKEGAKAFAQAKPPPSAEWLYVFDPFGRYAKPQRIAWNDQQEIDPFDLYGLDDDPPRPIEPDSQRSGPPGRDFLAWNTNDEIFAERIHFAAWKPNFSNRLPTRLEALASWFGEIMDEPEAVRWSAGRPNLNPNVLWYIRRGMDGRSKALCSQSKTFWRFFLTLAEQAPGDGHDLRWYDLKEMIKAEGWGYHTIQTFEKITQPYVTFRQGSLISPYPSKREWGSLDLRAVVDFEVKFLDRHGDKLDIPLEFLSDTVSVVRRNFVKGAALMTLLGKQWWGSPTLHPTGERGESFDGKKVQQYLWFKSLFDKLLDSDESAAKVEFSQWNPSDPIFFGKLCIFYAPDLRLCSSRQAFDLITGLSNEVFWNPQNQRELLFSLKALWPRFNATQRRRIERQIITGPNKWESEKKSEFRIRKASYSASRLRWLELNECELTAPSATRLKKLKGVDERWSDDWARAADDSFGSRGGVVARVTEPQGLETLSIDEIVSVAERKTEDRFRELTDYRPFVGLVEVAPHKALWALRRSLKDGKFPERFWQNLLSDWPSETSLRLRFLLAETIAQLAPHNARKLRHYTPDWVKKHIADLARADRAKALSIFDNICEAYLTAPTEVLSSGVGDTTVGGVRQDKSEVSISKAINSPGGKLAEALWELVPRPRKDRGMPEYLATRFDRLFSLPGDGAGHAVAVIAQRMGWLDYWFHDWTRDHLLPLFDLENALSEAAWHGLAYDRNGLSRETLHAMNSSFLGVLRGDVPWTLDEQEYRQHIHRLVSLSQPDIKMGAINTFEDVRSVLISVDDLGRSEAVSALSNILQRKRNWGEFVKPFLTQAWPKQLAYKGEMASRAFASLLAEAGDDFPDAAEVIIPLLRPVSHLDMFAYYMAKDDDEKYDFARRFPEATLSVLATLVDENRPTAPYGLPAVLDRIAEATPSLKRRADWRRLRDLTI